MKDWWIRASAFWWEIKCFWLSDVIQLNNLKKPKQPNLPPTPQKKNNKPTKNQNQKPKKKPPKVPDYSCPKNFYQKSQLHNFSKCYQILEHALNCGKVTAESEARKTHIKGQADSFNKELNQIFQRSYEIL